MIRKSKSLFPDDNAIRVMAETKQAEADAPPGPEKRKLQKEANSYRYYPKPKDGLPESYGRRDLSAERSASRRRAAEPAQLSRIVGTSRLRD